MIIFFLSKSSLKKAAKNITVLLFFLGRFPVGGGGGFSGPLYGTILELPLPLIILLQKLQHIITMIDCNFSCRKQLRIKRKVEESMKTICEISMVENLSRSWSGTGNSSTPTKYWIKRSYARFAEAIIFVLKHDRV